ncbi:NAD(P)/FAD-dependent oxidoreductase [Pyrodictium abyssi]|uniref:NAD(P)/FAD-dependent oxidoreductase n=1 Tax=Pyrodictium abyssi TaxID=54256 RepID=A0ABM8IXD4_9CREN|nr:NAD(P)/FAD-dependent oxidoreductase [Pyrodictium abyssi]
MATSVRPDFVVVGAGPAGAAFAYYASARGYSVEVYEGADFAAKPCGWAVPLQIEKYIKILSDAILSEINGFRVYVDGQLVHESHGQRWGYIVDKRLLIKSLLESATVHKKYVDLTSPTRPRVGSMPLQARERVVLAPGLVGLPNIASETILAVQQIFRTSRAIDTDVIEIWFDSNLVGYYWVFPRSQNIVDIGVGGYEGAESLRSRLRSFAKMKLGHIDPITPIKGARINVSGVNENLLTRNVPIIGEAAGFVYPLTGEGIRPSIASAYALFNSIIENNNPLDRVKSIVKWVNLQRKLLNKIRASSPETRARVISSLPLDVFTSLGLGELSLRQLLRALPSLPRSVASILRTVLG